MSRHVFIETNWLVDAFAPAHLQVPAALDLLMRARAGEFLLHLPAFCIGEARRRMRKKYQTRNEANSVRSYLRWGVENRGVTPAEQAATYKVLDRYEADSSSYFRQLDDAFHDLRRDPYVDIFPMDDRQLALSVEISMDPEMVLKPFDHAVLAAVLGRSDTIREKDGRAEISFCELDSDLWPWDKIGNPRPALNSLYDDHRVWVYGDFTMQHPPRPSTWPDGEVR